MKPSEIQLVLTEHAKWLLGANLHGANLCGADLHGADLRSASLTDASLTGADLRDADLHGADLTDANLRDANLCGAYVPLYSRWPVSIVNNKIAIGCKTKTVEEWDAWFAGNDEYETPRGTPDFRRIRAHYLAARAYVFALKENDETV